jgi:hypothetical protein
MSSALTLKLSSVVLVCCVERAEDKSRDGRGECFVQMTLSAAEMI